jgi:F0F1-type ATP synthase assembly protein I
MALDPERFRKWAQVAAIGPVLAISVVGGTLLGAWADKKLGSAPWGMLAGLLLGTIGGFREMLRSVREARDDGARRGRKERGRGQDKP